MLIRLALKRYARTIKEGILNIGIKLRKDYEYIQLISKLKLHKYVPKYFTRTEAEHREIRRRLRQIGCRHLKGGRIRNTFSKDYNVFDHTYIDGSRMIGCMTCRKKWTPASFDWSEALSMTESSTNGATSSEHLFYEVKYSNGTYKRYLSVEEARKDNPEFKGEITTATGV